MSLLPSRPDASPSEDAGPRVIGVDSDDADEVLSALSSGTARELLAQLHDDPAPPSELADAVDTSLQNVQYHLEKLQNAGAVEVVDTAYSAKGREMDVYAPADQPLVIFAGDDGEGSTLRTALSRLLGAVGVLAFASLAVQQLYGESLLGGAPTAGGDGERIGDGDAGAAGGGADAGADGYQAETAATDTPTPEMTERPATTAAPDGGDGGGISIAEATPQETTEAPVETPSATATEPDTIEPAETATQTATESAAEATRTVTETATNATETPIADVARETAAGLPPGLIFFAGGLFAIGIVAGVFYIRN